MVFPLDNSYYIEKIAGKYSPIVKIGWEEISKKEKEINQLKWFRIIKKIRLKSEINEIRYYLANIGLVKGLENLEEMGILKRIKQ